MGPVHQARKPSGDNSPMSRSEDKSETGERAELGDLVARLHDERAVSDGIINGLPGIFYLLDTRGWLIRWNRNLEHVTGLTSEQLARMHALELWTEEDHPRIRATTKAILRDGSSGEIEARLHVADGTHRPYLLTAMRIDLEGETHLVGFGIDISEQKRLEQELEMLAVQDPLTGTYNRRMFPEFVSGEIERSARYGTRFSLVMLDVDHFKSINDTYGHAVGDRVLTEIPGVLQATTRRPDVLFRWGGEEFVLLLPETDQAGAMRLAELIRERIASVDLEGVGQITVSLGVAEDKPGESLDGLLRRVDDALYGAKRAGRNRVSAVD